MGAPRARAGREAHKPWAAPAGLVATRANFVTSLAIPDRMGRSVSVEAAGYLRAMHTLSVAEVAAEATSAVVEAGALVTRPADVASAAM